MPHFEVHYSANLEERADVPSLCEAIRQAALSTGHFETGGIRVRAIRCDSYAVADAHPDNAFVDIWVKIGVGRSAEEKKTIGKTVFDAAAQCLAAQFEAPHLAMSLEIREINPELSWRKNSIHPRLRST